MVVFVIKTRGSKESGCFTTSFTRNTGSGNNAANATNSTSAGGRKSVISSPMYPDSSSTISRTVQ